MFSYGLIHTATYIAEIKKLHSYSFINGKEISCDVLQYALIFLLTWHGFCKLQKIGCGNWIFSRLNIMNVTVMTLNSRDFSVTVNSWLIHV